jgi:hypothetical protein
MRLAGNTAYAGKDALDEKGICDSGPRVGRRKEYPDKCIAALPPNTFVRIGRVLCQDEDRTDLLREAVEREITRRESAVEEKLARKEKGE